MALQSPQNSKHFWLVVAALVLLAISFAPIQCDSNLTTGGSGGASHGKQSHHPSNDGQQSQQAAASAATAESGRQGRAITGQNANENQLLGNQNQGIGNVIEHSTTNSRKSYYEAEKRQVQEFLTSKNIIKSIIKLLFGNQDEVRATSRNVLSVLTKVLDLLKNTFGQKSRNGVARTIRDSAEDAASAGVSMLQGYVKSVLASDDRCVLKHLCQASRDATRDSRDLGFIIASVGGYASSYLLDNSKQANFKSLYEASLKGRTAEDCAKLYSDCTE